MKTIKPAYIEIPYRAGYVVDQQGRIYSLKRWRTPRRMAEQVNRYGYPCVHLHVDGKSRVEPVHKLVCMAFYGAPHSGQEVRHIDGNRANNHPDNLSWGSRSENAIDRSNHGNCKSGENGRKATNAMLADGRLTRRANGTFQFRGKA